MPGKSRTLADVAASIDAQLKAAFSDCKFNVTTSGDDPLFLNDHIFVALMAAPDSPLIQQSLHPIELNHWAIQHSYMNDETVQLLTGDGLKFMKRVVEIVLDQRRRSSSDFNPAFVFHLQIGGLNEPFKVTT